MLDIWFVSAFHKMMMHNTSKNILYLALCLWGYIFREDSIILLAPNYRALPRASACARRCLVACEAALWNCYHYSHFFKEENTKV